MPARGDEVGLDEALVRRSGRRERGEAIVRGVVGRPVVGHSADGDDVRVVRRYADAVRVRARVPRGDDDHDPGLPGLHYRLVQRVLPVVRPRRRAERAVEDPDSVAHAVRHRPVDAPDHGGVGARTVDVEGLDRHEACVGGDAVVTLARRRRVQDEARDVGPVAALVRVPEGGSLPVDHVAEGVVLGLDPDGARRRAVRDRVVPVAAVEDRDVHPSTPDPFRVELRGAAERRVGVALRIGAVEGDLHVVEVDGVAAVVGGQERVEADARVDADVRRQIEAPRGEGSGVDRTHNPSHLRHGAVLLEGLDHELVPGLEGDRGDVEAQDRPRGPGRHGHLAPDAELVPGQAQPVLAQVRDDGDLAAGRRAVVTPLGPVLGPAVGPVVAPVGDLRELVADAVRQGDLRAP